MLLTKQRPRRNSKSGGSGHIANGPGCKSTTHSRGQCTVNPRETTTSAETYRVEPLPSAPKTNCFLKNAYFNEVPASCVIDTGSSDILGQVSLAERSSAAIRWVTRPLFTVGDSNQPGAATLGEAMADITIDGASAADHPVLVVSDLSIPVDVNVGRTWLNLSHINYYKGQDELVIEQLSAISRSAMSEQVAAECTDVYTALVSADKPALIPLSDTDIKIDSSASKSE